MKTLLIDAEILLYTICFAVEELVTFDNKFYIAQVNMEKGQALINKQVSDWMEKLDGEQYYFAWSDPANNFRKDIYPGYKKNRVKKRKPYAYKMLRDFMQESYKKNNFSLPSLEGDDVLGVLSTSDLVKGEKIIISTDKDMKTIPGLLFNQKEEGEGVQEITESEADYNFYTQILTGDSADGYPGCPGIGPKRAQAILDPITVRGGRRNAWPYIVAAYEKANLSEDVALRQARCARILRDEDYDRSNNTIKLWKPSAKWLVPGV